MDASMVYACDAPVGEFRTAHLEPILRKALEMRADKRHNWAKDAVEALLPNAQFPPGANVTKVQVAATTVCKWYNRHRKKGAPPAMALAAEHDMTILSLLAPRAPLPPRAPQAAQARQAPDAHVQSAGELSRPPKGLWVTRQARMLREMQM